MAAIFACLSYSLCECVGALACSCCMSIINATLAQATRFGHLLILVSTFALAIGLGKVNYSSIQTYAHINMLSNCDDNYSDECVYRNLIFRASCSLFVLFGVLALISTVTDYANKNLWVLKFVFAYGLFGI